jgi:hypothetical protein
MILTPKLVALDTSHWNKWLRDVLSPDTSVRRGALRFRDSLLDLGYTILFCWHHLQELLAVGNKDVAASRLHFIRDIPFLSWIGTLDADGLGSITDVMAAEALVIYQGAAEPPAVRSAAKSLLLKSGPGNSLVPDHPLFLSIMHEWAQQSADKARTITAISPIDFIDPRKKIGELMAGRIRKPDQRDRVLIAQHRAVTAEIALHGDRRITNAQQRADVFMSEVLAFARTAPPTARELVLRGLSLQGIDEDEVDPAATIEELGRLGVFRSQLRVVAPKTGIPFAMLKRRVRAEQMPHQIIVNALRVHGQKLAERKGSDLNDGYLATLAAYADVLCVDKRVEENFRRGLRKEPQLQSLVGHVEKTSDYRAIPDMLRSLS